MNALSQFAVVTGVVLRTIPQRLGWSAAATIGIALVVAVMVGVSGSLAGLSYVDAIAAIESIVFPVPPL